MEPGRGRRFEEEHGRGGESVCEMKNVQRPSDLSDVPNQAAILSSDDISLITGPWDMAAPFAFGSEDAEAMSLVGGLGPWSMACSLE